MSRRIALFADVHANLPALQAVVADAQSRGIDEAWNLGDMVGYAPFPNETISLLRRQCSRHILGNHDIKCAEASHAAKMRAAGKDPDKVFSFEWTHQELNADNLAFISGLQRTDRVEVGGVRILLTHGSPRGTNDCLTPRTPVEKFQAIAAALPADSADVVLCGHTHEFFDRGAGVIRFINPGGVGRSFDNDTRASYCVLEIKDKVLSVKNFRVAYSVPALLDEMHSRGFPEKLIRSCEEARSLEDLGGLKSADTEKCLRAAAELSEKNPHDAHARQVMRLAALIFEGLKPLHKLGWREGVYLRAGAILHDIGWVYGKEGHHKASRDLILKDRTLPLDSRERSFVALIARYHRGSLPSPEHRFYCELTSYEQETVSVLAACLRIADSLDRSHRSLVDSVSVSIGEKRVLLSVKVRKNRDVTEEVAVARVKSNLLERIFGLPAAFKIQP